MKIGELAERRLQRAATNMRAPEPLSLAQRLAMLPDGAGARVIDGLTPSESARLLCDWRMWARPTQLAPRDHTWLIWLLLSGRGWGKTRTGAEWVRERIERGEAKSIGLIGSSLSDVWKEMVYGTDDAPGIKGVFDYLPDRLRPVIRRTDREIRFHTGAVARIFTAEEPEVRGPNIDTWWCDELAKWRYLQSCWDNIEMTLRARGRTPPRICITTTPRPLKIIKELLDDPDVRVTFGSTFANASNLAPSFIRRMLRRYASSRQGLQELYGMLLDDNPDSLFRSRSFETSRINDPGHCPELARIVVAVDPAVTAKDHSDETGIIVLGIDARGEIYVLADLSGKYTPEEWGNVVVDAYFGHRADAVIGETNRGGDLVKANARAALFRKRGARAVLPFDEVHATRGKVLRADPVSTMYQQGRIHHVGMFAQLEDEMCEWNPRVSPLSPNRLDALVWGVHALCPELSDNVGDMTKGFAGIEEANAEFVGASWDPLTLGGGRAI